MFRSSSKKVVILVASAYVFIAIFGMSMFIMPSEHGDMMGGGCPLMRDVGSLCQTGVLDHIAHWNILFAAILSVGIVIVAIRGGMLTPSFLSALSQPNERYRWYVKDTPHVRLFQPLLQLFSSGIIQPKIFS